MNTKPNVCFAKAAREPDYFLRFDNIKAGIIQTLRQRNATPNFKTARLSRITVFEDDWKTYSRQRKLQEKPN